MCGALSELLDVTLQPSQWVLARLHLRRGGLGILDVDVAAPAHVASFLSSAAGAAENGLPWCRVPPSFFKALAAMEPSSPGHVNALRVLLTVGSPTPRDLDQRKLFEDWCNHEQWTTTHHEAASMLLAGSLPCRSRLLLKLFSATHAGSWLLSPSPRNPSPR